MNKISLYILFFSLLFWTTILYGQKDFKNPQEYAKEANKLFEKEEFIKAYPYYQTLRSNDVGNPDYNFRLGVCMMYSEPENKTRPIYYFQIALKRNITDNRIYYYLGRAYHNNYRFLDAKKAYSLYKEKAKERSVKSFDINRRIEECNNGIALLSHIKLLYVIDKQLVKDATFYKSYNLDKTTTAKIIAVPPDLLTRYDRKHKAPPFGLYVPEGRMIYYASYGSNGEMGLDIFRAHKIPGEGWEKPENLGPPINTKYDDAYPYISPDGRILYFSSKGHNCMGGYDIFKSEFSLNTFSWGKVENLNFPINTPFDDIFFVPDTSSTMAYFSSDRQSLAGKVYVYHIGLNKKAEEQDLAKAFREDKDAVSLSKLLKDIADLKTNINVNDYKTKIHKEVNKTLVDTNAIAKKKVRKNNNPITKLEVDDYKQMDRIVNSSYNTYKKFQYKSRRLRMQKNKIGKIAADNDKLAAQLRVKGDSESLLQSHQYIKMAKISRDIAKGLSEQINETDKAAKEILRLSGYLQRYAGMHNKDSLQIVYAKIIKLKDQNDSMPDVADEIVNQQESILIAKRKLAAKKYKEEQDALAALNSDKAELKEYEDALSSVTDADEKQDYVDMIAAMKTEVAKKTAAHDKSLKEYTELNGIVNKTAVSLSKVDEVLSSYHAVGKNFANSPQADSLKLKSEETIVAIKKKEDLFVKSNAKAIVANTQSAKDSTTLAQTETAAIANNQSKENTLASPENTQSAKDSTTLSQTETAAITNKQSKENTLVSSANTQSVKDSTTLAQTETAAIANNQSKENTLANSTNTQSAKDSTTLAQTESAAIANNQSKENTLANSTNTQSAKDSTTLAQTETAAIANNQSKENTLASSANMQSAKDSSTLAQTETAVIANNQSKENTLANSTNTQSAKDNTTLAQTETAAIANKQSKENTLASSANTQSAKDSTTVVSTTNGLENAKSINKTTHKTNDINFTTVVSNSSRNKKSNSDTSSTSKDILVNQSFANNQSKENTLASSTNTQSAKDSTTLAQTETAAITNKQSKENTLASSENTQSAKDSTTLAQTETAAITNNQSKENTLARSENTQSAKDSTTLAQTETAAITNKQSKENTLANSTNTQSAKDSTTLAQTETAALTNNQSKENTLASSGNIQFAKDSTTLAQTETASTINAQVINRSDTITENSAIVANDSSAQNGINSEAVTSNLNRQNIDTAIDENIKENTIIKKQNAEKNTIAELNNTDTIKKNILAKVNKNQQQLKAISDTTNLTNSTSTEDKLLAEKEKKKTEEYQNLVEENKRILSDYIDTLNIVISRNDEDISKLKQYAVTEYQNSNTKDSILNQLTYNFNEKSIKDTASLKKINSLKKQVVHHKMNAVAATQLVQKLEVKNNSNKDEYTRLLVVEEQTAELNPNINGDSLASVANKLSQQIAAVTMDTINANSLSIQTKKSLDSLNNIQEEIIHQQQLISSISTENTAANSLAIDDAKAKLMDLQKQETNLSININKAHVQSTILATIAKQTSPTKEIVLPSELIAESTVNTSFDTSITNKCNTSEIATETALVANKNTSTKLIAENIKNPDSIYLPVFQQKELNDLAAEFLSPEIKEIDHLKHLLKKNTTEEIQSVQLANNANKQAESIANEINTIKFKLANTDDSAQIVVLVKDISIKQQQYINLKRKATAAILYANMVNKEDSSILVKQKNLSKEFITNRTKIADLDTVSLSSSNLEQVENGSLNQNAIVAFVKTVKDSNDILNQRLLTLQEKKSALDNQYFKELQKLDEISYSIEGEKKPNKKTKLQKQLHKLEIVANKSSSEVKAVQTVQDSIEYQIQKNKNLIVAIEAHQQEIALSEIPTEASRKSVDTLRQMQSMALNMDIFNTKSQLTAKELGMAYVKISSKPKLPYYVTNSIDLVYFNNEDIPKVKRALLKQQNKSITQEIDVLSNKAMVTTNSNEKTAISISIDDLKAKQNSNEREITTIENKILASGEAVDSAIINSETVLANIQKEAKQYTSISQRLRDTAKYFTGYEKQKVLALSRKVNTKADSVNKIYIELTDIKLATHYHDNNILLAKMQTKAVNGQISNQAKMQIEEAKQNILLANQSKKSADNPELSAAERQQFISQAKQYEVMALSNQQNALKLYNTEVQQTEALASSQNNSSKANVNSSTTGFENNNGEIQNPDSTTIASNASLITDSIGGSNENLSLNTISTSKDNFDTSTVKVKSPIDTTVNRKNIELENLVLVDPTKLTPKEKVSYEIKKADIIGAYIGNNRRGQSIISFYSPANPIQINPAMPMGLLYKIQIAAFRKPIPPNTFGDIKPISAEKVSNSAFTRYMAGIFTTYNLANISKQKLRRKGYKDAFVVAYFNGKRITNAQAKAIIAEGRAYTDSQLAISASKLKVASYGINQQEQQLAKANNPNDTGKPLSKELGKNTDLVYSVQIGVFGGIRSSERLANAPDLFYDRTRKAYYRYFSGKYSSEQEAIAARNVIRTTGIKDAFVVVFYKSTKISLTKARKIAQNSSLNANSAEVQNTVTTTAENNKNTIVYKVQLGAFNSPRQGIQLKTIKDMSLNGIDTYINKSGLLIYTSGAYNSYLEAQNARNQIRAKGYTDVFIVAFENNKRISTRVARQKLGY